MEVVVPAIAALLTLIALGGGSGGWSVRGQSTQVGFYSSSCPRAESVVQSTVKSHFGSDPTVAPGLLRLHFHDCFVRGCDASILIDGANTERTGGPAVTGFNVIDDAKKQLERACPGVVSCADILALAARDSVVLAGGRRWEVPTGRRDGRISVASETSNLPSFSDSVDVQKKKFAAKGLDSRDLVTLVGGHTIGTTSCQFFSYRLNNFTAAGGPDPSISPAFLTRLRSLCPANGDGSKRVALDTGSVNRFDISFFRNLQSGQGVLESDQSLWTDSTAKTFVQQFLGIGGSAGLSFDAEFGRSMVKMSNIQVLTGKKGEIRKVCSAIN